MRNTTLGQPAGGWWRCARRCPFRGPSMRVRIRVRVRVRIRIRVRVRVRARGSGARTSSFRTVRAGAGRILPLAQPVRG